MKRNKLIFTFASVLAFSALASEPESSVDTYGDWSVRCITTEAGAKACDMYQQASDAKNGKRVLQSSIAYRAGAKAPMMVAALPLGVLLEPGASLSVDDKPWLKKTRFVRCEPAGCLLQVQLDKKTVARLKQGKKAHWTVNATDKQTLDIPFSLKGFSQAIAALKKG